MMKPVNLQKESRRWVAKHGLKPAFMFSIEPPFIPARMPQRPDRRTSKRLLPNLISREEMNLLHDETGNQEENLEILYPFLITRV